ncbi:MAG: proline--tRNA ligase, partial [Bacteroidota bacterium]
KRDLAKGVVEVARRDTKEKETQPLEGVAAHIEQLLEDIQNNLFQRALEYRDAHITRVDDFDTFKEVLENKGGFVSAHWDGTTETELKIKELTKATIRCIPVDAEEESGTCVLTGKPSNRRVLFAKAY